MASSSIIFIIIFVISFWYIGIYYLAKYLNNNQKENCPEPKVIPYIAEEVKAQALDIDIEGQKVLNFIINKSLRITKASLEPNGNQHLLKLYFDNNEILEISSCSKMDCSGLNIELSQEITID